MHQDDSTGRYPDHYPLGCPPDDAFPATMLVYRVCSPDMKSPDDFLSHYDRNPVRFTKCEHRSLSVFTNPEDAVKLIASSERYEGFVIYKGFTQEESGVIKHSPQKYRSHHDWWIYRDVDVRSLFTLWSSEGGDPLGSL